MFEDRMTVGAEHGRGKSVWSRARRYTPDARPRRHGVRQVLAAGQGIIPAELARLDRAAQLENRLRWAAVAAGHRPRMSSAGKNSNNAFGKESS